MEGADLVEVIVVICFLVDGEGVIDFLVGWVWGLWVHVFL